MTDPPRRLLDDAHVTEQLRADLREAAAYSGPSFELEGAVRRFEATLQGSPSARRRQGVALGLGVATLAASLAAAAFGLRSLLPSSQTLDDRAPYVGASAPTSVVHQNRAAPSTPLGASPDSVPSGAGEARPNPSVKHQRLRTPVTSSVHDARKALLDREVAHLATIRATLASSPARAVELANSGHREFAGGALYVEREALAISALSRLGRVAEARARGDALARAFPRHPFVEQVRRQTRAD